MNLNDEVLPDEVFTNLYSFPISHKTTIIISSFPLIFQETRYKDSHSWKAVKKRRLVGIKLRHAAALVGIKSLIVAANLVWIKSAASCNL